ncbi:lipopolysaccharide biosynthesis protein WzzE [compost metagenome]
MKNAGNQVEIKEHDLQQKIAAMRETAKIHREDRLAKLREALAIAEAVGLDKPLLITNESAQQLSGIIEGDLMYMRGAKAIRAEINSLDARKSDDPFISGLRALEQRLALFKGIEIEPKRVAVFRLDGPVEVPEVPVKPKKVVVLLIGGFIGALLGGGLACVRLIVRGRPIKGTVSQS